MRIVVVGDGKVGRTLTERLTLEGHDVMVIDNSERALSEATNTLDVMGICGNGASRQVQLEAGVDSADLLIAATSGDELNLLCCLVAKKLGARHTIARVRNPEYSDQMSLIREELGLSMAVNPEFAAANEIFSILRFPAALKVEKFNRGRVELVELKLAEDSPLDGMPLYNIYKKYQVKVLICGVRRGGEVIIPGGDFVLRAGDKISFTAAPAEIQRFFRAVGIEIRSVGGAILVGGGRIAYYLTRLLSQIGIHPKIIDMDEARCRHLSEMFPKALIIHGDGTDQELLREEGLASADAFVALTGLDEENIILSMYAASQGVGKVVTKVNRSSLVELVGSVGLDSIISPKDITASQIVRYVRAMQNSLGSNVETLYKIVGGAAEALEFRARENFDIIGIPLKDLTLRPNLLVACISRGRETIIPGGEDSIQIGDRVIVVTTNPQLNDLHDILAR